MFTNGTYTGGNHCGLALWMEGFQRRWKNERLGRDTISSAPAIVVNQPWEPEKHMWPQMLRLAEVTLVQLFILQYKEKRSE